MTRATAYRGIFVVRHNVKQQQKKACKGMVDGYREKEFVVIRVKDAQEVIDLQNTLGYLDRSDGSTQSRKSSVLPPYGRWRTFTNGPSNDPTSTSASASQDPVQLMRMHTPFLRVEINGNQGNSWVDDQGGCICR